MSTHYADDSETYGFADWLNRKLRKLEQLQKYLPLDVTNLFDKLSDGVILCKYVETINSSVIDSRAINFGDTLLIYRIHENCQLVIRASQSLGCCTVNIGPTDIHEKNEHIVKGLLWQQIRLDLLQNINLKNHPNILVLMEDDETIEQFRRLSPEEILVRWVNYHIGRSDRNHLKFRKFNTDLKNSEIYGVLLKQIAPQNPTDPIVLKNGRVKMIDMDETDLEKRAKNMLIEAAKMECDFFIRPKDVVTGHNHLNLAFTANLFNLYPALEDVEYEEVAVEETREEKTIRSWVNSLGVSPYVNDLKFDLFNGLVYCEILNILKPGCIAEKEIQKKVTGSTGNFNILSNCTHAINYGRDQFGFSMVNIDASNLKEGHLKFILSILSQAMRYDFVRMLQAINPGKTFADSDILDWVNSKLSNKVSGFKDDAFSNSKPIFELIDAVKENMYEPSYINDGESPEEMYSNAKLALSVVRKMGGKVFALPEDVTEHKSRPIMLLCASIMIIDCNKEEN